MKTFEVEGWYRYSNGDEKDFEVETITCSTSPEEAINFFKRLYPTTRFFKIDIKEI